MRGHGVGGVARRKSACRTRAVAAVEAASSPRPRAGQPLCVRHTARRRLWGVQLARQGLGAGGAGEKEPRTRRCAGGGLCRLPIAICVRATAGLRRARALEPKRCASQRNRKFADGGFTSGRKSSNWSSRAKPDEAVRGAGGMRLDRGPSPSRSASAARRARARSKRRRKKAAARRAPTAEEAHRMHAGNPLFDPRGVSPDTWRLDKECRWKGARSKLDRNEPNVRKKKREDKKYSVLWQQ